MKRKKKSKVIRNYLSLAKCIKILSQDVVFLIGTIEGQRHELLVEIPNMMVHLSCYMFCQHYLFA